METERNKGGRPNTPKTLQRRAVCFSMPPDLIELLYLIPNKSRFVEKAIRSELIRINKAHGQEMRIYQSTRIVRRAENALMKQGRKLVRVNPKSKKGRRTDNP